VERCVEECRRRHCIEGGRFCRREYWLCAARCGDELALWSIVNGLI